MLISKNFDSKEFECPCCGKQEMNKEFVYFLQGLRDAINYPIIITKGGGFRCKAYNKKIGGAKSSYHMKGLAVDCYVKYITLKNFHKKIIMNFWGTFRGLGVSREGNFIHLDEGRRFARWIYLNKKPYYF